MVATDPRYRQKVLLDNYLTAANMTEDNGSTNASYVVMFAFPDYPLTEEFDVQAVDIIFTVDEPSNVTPLLNSDYTTYGYEEHMPVAIWVIDKTGITGAKLKWKAETELRRIIETYYLGSLRTLGGGKPVMQSFGSTIFYGYQYEWVYKRSTTA